MSPTNLNLATRGIFVLIAAALGVIAALAFAAPRWQGALAGAVFGVSVVLLDAALRNFTFRGFSHATIGLLVGLFCGALIHHVFQRLLGLIDLNVNAELVADVAQVAIYMTFGYWGMSLAMRSNRQEFSFIIPYVRFHQDSAQDSPLLVDTNIIIDGRIARICETGFLSGALVVPRFVLDELHLLADSPDPVRRERGKRGLECLKEMQNSPSLEVTIHEDYQKTETLTDTKLIQLARKLGARLMTNDSNLGKVAQLQGVTVLNLNLLARSMRPTVVPGDHMQIKVVKEGKDDHQGVGYLDDGTMIVVNHARAYIGETVDVVIGTPLQTSAGRLIFAELKDKPSQMDKGPGLAEASAAPAEGGG